MSSRVLMVHDQALFCSTVMKKCRLTSQQSVLWRRSVSVKFSMVAEPISPILIGDRGIIFTKSVLKEMRHDQAV